MFKRLCKMVGHLLIPIMLITSTTLPHAAAAQEFKALWLNAPVSTASSVQVPAEKWTAMVRVKRTQVDQVYSYEYQNNERWQTLSREDAALVPGLTARQMSTLMEIPRRNAVMVFGRYSPQQSELVINAIKVENGTDGYVYVYQTYFSPYHGEHWAAARNYLTQTEMLDTSRPGRNPFEAFKAADRNDPRFRGIGWDGAMVAVGLAQKYFGAPYSAISVQNLRMTQKKETSGSFLRKKTTIKVDGYAVPTWFIGLPTTVQTWGTVAAICVVPTATGTDPDSGRPIGASCPDDRLVAFSGVSFDEWKGNTFPMQEEHIYHWEKTSSGFTVLAFTLIVMAAAFFVGPELYAYVTAEGGAAAAGAVELAPAVAITSGEAAVYSGIAYAGGSLATSGGGASLTSQKDGIFGSIGDGIRDPNDPSSPQQKEAAVELVKRHIRFDPTNELSCADQSKLCSTTGGLSSVTPDATAIQLGKDQKSLRERDRYCRMVKKLKGDDLVNCIVPRKMLVDVP